jgi:hypothetical protein
LIILFSIAVTYITKEGRNIHFHSLHGKIGLAMFILTTIQIVRGKFRPRLTYPGSDKEKTKWRKGWEAGHRFLGAVLLFCGFWQMGSGIKLFSNKYSISESEEAKQLLACWVRVGATTSIIFIGIWYSKIRKLTTNEPSFASSNVDGIDADVSIPKNVPFDVESDDVSTIVDIVYGPSGTPPRVIRSRRFSA